MNTYELSNSMITEDYILNRIVYVNSANHGYSEIQLDSHLVMFGGNNKGKTASLAGTKLLLFPEVNFKKCESKFGFEGKSGFFTKEASSHFYFPSLQSFIIQEVTNPEGTFCMVLHKGTDYRYGRYFIPVAYDALRGVFWDSEANTFASDISIEAVKRFTKLNDGVYVNEEKELRRYMFESLHADKQTKRFCVLPLKDSGSSAISAFKHIYQLAFNPNLVETTTLPSAIATLIEMGRGREQEKLNADLLDINKTYQDLHRREQNLQSCKNNQHLYKRAHDQFQKLANNYEAYSKHAMYLEKQLELAENELGPTLDKLKAQFTTEDDKKTKLDGDLTKLNDDIQTLQGTISNLKTRIKTREDKITTTKSYLGRFGDMGFRQIEEDLEAEIHTLEEEISGYEADKSSSGSLQSKLTKQNQKREQKASIEAILNGSHEMLLSQVGKAASNVLFSLNTQFESMSVAISEPQKSTIEAFTALFSEGGDGKLRLLGQSMNGVSWSTFDKAKSIKKAEITLESVERELEAVDKEILKLSKIKTPEQLQSLILEKKKELTQAKSNLMNIRALESDEAEQKSDTSELSDLEEAHLGIKQSFSAKEVASSEQAAVVSTISASKEKAEQQEAHLSEYKTKLARARQTFSPGAANVGDSSVELQLNNASFDALIDSALSCSSDLSSLRTDVYSLMIDVPHPDIDKHKQIHDYGQCKHAMHAYDTLYASLDYELTQLSNEIGTHNQFINSQLNELKSAKALLQSFLKEINQELNTRSVSNLSEIELVATINPAFESLLSALSTQNVTDDSLLGPEFYSSIAKFVRDYFDSSTNRLKLNDIIEKITYTYVLAQTGERQDKSQSGGTTTTITAFVISVLLKRITPKFVNLNMPIIVDEIGTLDRKNMESTLDQIQSHGFSMFCATPNFTGHLCRSIKRWVHIDHNTVSVPMVEKCDINILPGDVESISEVTCEA